MSVEATTMAWASDAEGNDLLVMLALADWAAIHDDDTEQRCWPSIAKIATRTKISARTVQRCIRSLEAMGAITVGEHPAWTGRADRRPHAYTIQVARGVISSPRDDERGDNGDTNGVSPVSPEPKEREPKETDPSLSGSSDPGSSKLYRSDGTPVALGALPVGVYPIEFEKTWLAYPKERREAKRTTYGAWSTTVRREVLTSKRDPHTVMLAIYRAVVNYRTAMQDREPRYVKLAQTFLGPGDCWRDYIEKPTERIERKEWET